MLFMSSRPGGRALLSCPKPRWFAAALTSLSLFGASAASQAEVVYRCEGPALFAAQSGMSKLLTRLQVAEHLVTVSLDATQARYALSTPEADTSTVYLRFRPEMGVSDETIQLPTRGGRLREVSVVSRKEILLALLQHGRTLELSGKACDARALEEHIEVRQNTAAWAEDLEWGWPEGGPAKWNTRYWNRGTLRARQQLDDAMRDVFVNRSQYEIGCYTATKFVMLQGVLDYYARVRPDAAKAQEVRDRLLEDGEALVGLEPRSMWSFEQDFDASDAGRPGKILSMQTGVAAENFVPGDWMYFLNTDPVSYEKTGYEGSNAIYLGRGRFNDHYNDNHHGYRYHEKLNMVFQWRHGVFSRSRDYDKMQPLTASDYTRFGHTPDEGGLLLDLRVGPYLFGYETLPALPERSKP